MLEWLRRLFGVETNAVQDRRYQRQASLEAERTRAREELYSEDYRAMMQLFRETGHEVWRERALEKRRQAAALHQEAQLLEAMGLLEERERNASNGG